LVRKKQGLITKGLTSELFLLAFLEPDNIRKLAQRLQNTSGHPTNYSKASQAVYNLTTSKYLKYGKDGKYHPNITKIIEDLEEILRSRGEILVNEDRLILEKLLHNNKFLKTLSQDVVATIQSQQKGKHSVNALEVFCERIGAVSTIWLVMRNNNPEWKSSAEFLNNMPFSEMEEKFNEFDKFADEYSPLFEKEMKKYLDKLPPLPNKEFLMQLFSGFIKIMSSGMPMFMAPESLLKKLAKLWKHYEGFAMAEQVFKFSSKLN